MNTNLYQCDNCGQIARITQEGGLMSVLTPTACPYCASTGLRRIRSTFVSLDAACFSHVNKRLAQLIYSVWANNQDDEQRGYPLFRDYLNHVLESEDE